MDPVERLRARLSRAAVLTDFDGTLAPIVEDPARAVPAPGAVRALVGLTDRAPVVGVVSGRPVAFLAGHLPDPRLHLAGIYGFERRDGGVTSDHPDAASWTEPVAAAADDLDLRVPEGVVVERKRLSLTIHYRRVPEAAADVMRLATSVAAVHGLTARPARKAVEVHPADAPDKGVVVAELASGCEAACFMGDDLGDVAAFEALDRLEADGLAVVRLAVESDETPEQLLERADVVLDGSDAAVAWLESLLV